jgi:hypothetical protein
MKLSCVPLQTIGNVTFRVVPDLLGRIEFRCLARALFQMQPRVCLTHGVDSPPVDRDMIPEHDEVGPHMPQERLQEVRNIKSFEVAGLEANIQAKLLAFGRHGERRSAEMWSCL